MADFKKRETKVLSIDSKSGTLSEREQKLKALQAAIDMGRYQACSENIAKAYLDKSHRPTHGKK